MSEAPHRPLASASMARASSYVASGSWTAAHAGELETLIERSAAEVSEGARCIYRHA